MGLKPGSRVKVKKGPYRGETVQLRSRTTEYDAYKGERRLAWFAWFENEMTLVFEDELKEVK